MFKAINKKYFKKINEIPKPLFALLRHSHVVIKFNFDVICIICTYV